jgi:hypothetical protein
MIPQPSKKQLDLHMSFPEMGTTSIQVRMAGNADLLAAHGVLFGYHRIPDALARTPLDELASSWPDMDALLSEISRTSANEVTISSEDSATKLDQVTVVFFARELSAVAVRFICYVRRQDEFIISVWCTAVPHHTENNPRADCLADPWLDYAWVVALWARAYWQVMQE